MNLVEFPNLGGLKFTINPVAFQVFGLPIYWYGIIIALGFMLAIFLALRSCQGHGIDPENLIDLILYATPVAIISARLYYVIFSWDQYRNNLSEIINTRRGGLAIYGGIIGALLVALIFTRVKKLSFMKILDFISPYIALAQAIGRWGNFVNQEAFGTNTTLPWGMTSDRIRDELTRLQIEGRSVNPALPVHPTFLYESLLDLCIFLFLIRYSKKEKAEGEVFFLYMISYGTGRFFIEGLRTDSLMLGNLRISQVLAFVFVLAFGIAFYLKRKKAAEDGENAETGRSEYGAVLRKLMDEEDIGYTNAATAIKQEETVPDPGKSEAEKTAESIAESINEEVKEPEETKNPEEVKEPEKAEEIEKVGKTEDSEQGEETGEIKGTEDTGADSDKQE